MNGGAKFFHLMAAFACGSFVAGAAEGEIWQIRGAQALRLDSKFAGCQ